MRSRRKRSPTSSTPVIVTGSNNSFSTALDNMRDSAGIRLSMNAQGSSADFADNAILRHSSNFLICFMPALNCG
jgi:hypothetical protein